MQQTLKNDMKSLFDLFDEGQRIPDAGYTHHSANPGVHWEKVRGVAPRAHDSYYEILPNGGVLLYYLNQNVLIFWQGGYAPFMKRFDSMDRLVKEIEFYRQVFSGDGKSKEPGEMIPNYNLV